MCTIASEFDGPWKEALEWYFEPFLAFFFPDIHSAIDWSREHEFLDKELQKVAPEGGAGVGTVDKLVKVWELDGNEVWVIVHVEVQSQRDVNFAHRMYSYNHRLEARFGRMPVGLAVLGDDSPGLVTRLIPRQPLGMRTELPLSLGEAARLQRSGSGVGDPPEPLRGGHPGTPEGD